MSLISLLIIACICTARANADTQDDYNELFDSVVDAIASYVSSNNFQTIDLGNVSTTYINATNGFLSDLSTIQRTDNASVTLSSGSGNINGSVTFSDFKINYDSFNFGLGDVTVGNCSATFTFSQIQFDIDIDHEVNENNECVVTVNQVLLSKLGDVSFKFDESGVENWTFEEVVPTLMAAASSTIISYVDHTQLEALTEYIFENVNLCEIINA